MDKLLSLKQEDFCRSNELDEQHSNVFGQEIVAVMQKEAEEEKLTANYDKNWENHVNHWKAK